MFTSKLTQCLHLWRYFQPTRSSPRPLLPARLRRLHSSQKGRRWLDPWRCSWESSTMLERKLGGGMWAKETEIEDGEDGGLGGSGASMQLDMFLLLLVSVAAKHRHNTLKNSAEIRNKKPRPYPLHLFFIYSVSSLLRNCLHQVSLNRWEHSARSHIEVKYRRSWCRGLLRVTYSSSLQASRLFFRFAFSFGFAAHSLSGFVSVFQKWQADVSMLFHSYKCWTELHLPLHDMKVSS